jgi:hypothetical protein
MRLRAISCEVLARPLYLTAAHSPHTVDFDLVDKGLHAEPARLRQALQEKIDAVHEGRYDAVVLGYALCSNSTAGLLARGLPLVLPRAHDCITLYLGSRQAYAEEFNQHPGTYYYTADYSERLYEGENATLGAVSEAEMQRSYDEYVAKYGKENADYLLQVMGGWRKNYRRAAYIRMGVGNEQPAEEAARQEAERNGWEFARLEGDMLLLRKLLFGQWDEDFLVVRPGEMVRVTYDEGIVQACPLAPR